MSSNSSPLLHPLYASRVPAETLLLMMTLRTENGDTISSRINNSLIFSFEGIRLYLSSSFSASFRTKN